METLYEMKYLNYIWMGLAWSHLGSEILGHLRGVQLW